MTLFKFWCFSVTAVSITKSHYVRDCNLSIALKRLMVDFYLQPTSLLSSNSHICSTHPGHPQSHHKETTTHICSVCFVELGIMTHKLCLKGKPGRTSDKVKETPHLLKGEPSKPIGYKMLIFTSCSTVTPKVCTEEKRWTVFCLTSFHSRQVEHFRGSSHVELAHLVHVNAADDTWHVFSVFLGMCCSYWFIPLPSCFFWKISGLVDLFFLFTKLFLFKQRKVLFFFLFFVSTILPLQSICSAFLPTVFSNGGNLAFFRQVNWIIYIMKPKSLTTSELTSAGPRGEMFHSSEGKPMPPK